jgi:hypothetical protein
MYTITKYKEFPAVLFEGFLELLKMRIIKYKIVEASHDGFKKSTDALLFPCKVNLQPHVK